VFPSPDSPILAGVRVADHDHWSSIIGTLVRCAEEFLISGESSNDTSAELRVAARTLDFTTQGLCPSVLAPAGQDRHEGGAR